MSTVVTRFAPSPTGYLHVGGARTALFNWLLAKNTGGKFLLRIEDTDLARSTDDAVRQLLEDLKWLGLNWDNAELVYQSRRLDIYNRVIEKLLSEGKAYEAWETNDELDKLKEAAAKAKRAYRYVKPNYTPDQIKKYRDEGRTPVIRFAMPVKEYKFRDVALDKEVTVSPYEVQDFVIRKTDGMPTYHFGVVVDDAEMGVTHVLRGLEHLLNTVNHIGLQEALGYERPTYAHLSVMLNPENGEKLSKRDRDRRIRKRVQDWMRNNKKSAQDLASASGLPEDRLSNWIATDTVQLDLTEQPKVMAIVGLKESDLPEIMIHDFRKNGYTPEVLLNFLALQGWSPGNDLEQMTISEMIEKFSIDRLVSSNPKFNREKLKSFSTDFFARAPMERQLGAIKDWLLVNPASTLNKASDAELLHILKMNHGFHILSELDEKNRFFFLDDAAIEFDAKSVEKLLKKENGQGLAALRDVRAKLAGVATWDAHSIETAVNEFVATSGLGLGKVAQPLRLAVSGSSVSPPIFETLAFLGQARTLARIDRCLEVNA